MLPWTGQKKPVALPRQGWQPGLTPSSLEAVPRRFPSAPALREAAAGARPADGTSSSWLGASFHHGSCVYNNQVVDIKNSTGTGLETREGVNTWWWSG